jgi:hypothetical protein
MLDTKIGLVEEIPKTQPSGLNCQLSNGTGTIAAAAITNIVIACQPATYSIGGSVSGLSAAGLVLANGSDTLSVPANASSFTMPTPLVTGSAYAVTVKSQPPALSCVVSSGTGTVGMAAVTSVKVQCATNGWVWLGGSSTINQKGVYGILGVGAAGNIPGARESRAFTTDLSGNFWLFGGYGADSSGVAADLSDLWMYNPTTGYWEASRPQATRPAHASPTRRGPTRPAIYGCSVASASTPREVKAI